MQTDEIKRFLDKAVTRSGVPFTVTHLQHSPTCVLTTLKGIVEVDGDCVPMFWDAQTGRALTQSIAFDLVTETGI